MATCTYRAYIQLEDNYSKTNSWPLSGSQGNHGLEKCLLEPGDLFVEN